MRESSTIQAFIEEGRRKGLEEGKAGEAGGRRIILLQGPMRFGAADDEVRNRLRRDCGPGTTRRHDQADT